MCPLATAAAILFAAAILILLGVLIDDIRTERRERVARSGREG